MKRNVQKMSFPLLVVLIRVYFEPMMLGALQSTGGWPDMNDCLGHLSNTSLLLNSFQLHRVVLYTFYIFVHGGAFFMVVCLKYTDLKEKNNVSVSPYSFLSLIPS